jgi:hypothetical protein
MSTPNENDTTVAGNVQPETQLSYQEAFAHIADWQNRADYSGAADLARSVAIPFETSPFPTLRSSPSNPTQSLGKALPFHSSAAAHGAGMFNVGDSASAVWRRS